MGMSKIFRTETLSVNGDNIRLTADSAGSFMFKTSGGVDIMGNATINSDVSSLQVVDVAETAARSSDVSSLQVVDLGEAATRASDISSLALEQANDSDVSSLQTEITTEENTRKSDVSSLQVVDLAETAARSSDVSSLQIADVAESDTRQSDVSSLQVVDLGEAATRASDVSSLSVEIGTNDVVVTGQDLAAASTSHTITWTSAFATAPVVVGTLRSTAAADPILACQMSGAANVSNVTFVFSDEIPSANYVLDVLASV